MARQCIAGHSLYNDERSFDLLWLIDGSTSLMSSRWAEIDAKNEVSTLVGSFLFCNNSLIVIIKLDACS